MRYLILIIVVIIVFGVGLFLGKILPFISFGNPPAKIENTTTMIKQIQTLSQLVSVKYVLEKVVILEDVKWYGENRVLLIAHGVVKAGVDFEKIGPTAIQVNKTKVTIKLPPPEITDVYLDDKQTRVIERTTGVMRVFDKDLEQNARRQAVDDLRRGARMNGILKEADERARAQLVVLFHQLGFQEIEIVNASAPLQFKRD